MGFQGMALLGVFCIVLTLFGTKRLRDINLRKKFREKKIEAEDGA